MPIFRTTSARKPDYSLLPEVIYPVVIVPGLLGTWPPNATGKLDPMTKLYANLHEALSAVGYMPGESLFEFPFDWRLDIDSLAQILSAFIANIRRTNLAGQDGPVLRQTRLSARPVDYSRVDIIAHSYGGVVARAYAQGDGRGKVRKLVEVATPNTGLLAAYHAYEAGDATFIGVPHEGAKGMIEIIALRESQHPLKALKAVPTLYRVVRGKSDADLVDYFRNRVPAILDLLPLARTDYIYSIEGETRTVYPFGYPENTRLERLSTPQALATLAETEEIYCVGIADSFQSVRGGSLYARVGVA